MDIIQWISKERLVAWPRRPSIGAYSESVELKDCTNLLDPVGVVGHDNSGQQWLSPLHSILQTVCIPIGDFAKINLADVKGVRLTFDMTATGAN